MKFWILVHMLVLLLGLAQGLGAENGSSKVVKAIRLEEPVRIDGNLDEKIWQTRGYSDFLQRDPRQGKPPTEKTTVWVAYDEKCLYVAARMEDSESDKIIGLLGRRDENVDSDWFSVALDPYFDKRSGYRFSITPAGSIADLSLYNDEWDDATWDGVWESAARIDDRGWAVEIRIPFNQLRFRKKDEYVWGINFHRIIKRKNEHLWYALVKKEDSGYVSRFARLEGIKDINPGRHIEMLPFMAGQAGFSPVDEDDPFDSGNHYLANAGIDFKVGLKSNLILDATVNPDFGQVEVDPAVINLSAYETYYDEKRPFFIEGSSIFNFGYGGSRDFWTFDWGNPSFFYSRRIGRSPQGLDYLDYDYADSQDWTTILAAAKLSGEIGKGWKMGFLNALTAREYADIDPGGAQSREEVEPFSYYGVLRTQKEYNEGRQGLGMIATSVIRQLDDENLASVLNKNAFALAVDGWTFLDKEKVWVVTGWLGGTMVSGSQEAISELQESALHYFQRPDAEYLELDPEATSLSGWAARFTLNKQKGNLMVNAAVGAISPGFDSTDLGFQWRGDIINGHVGLGYRWLKPGKIFRDAYVITATHRNYDFGGIKTGEAYYLLLGGDLKNYWGGEVLGALYADALSDNLTRGGPLMLNPGFVFTRFNFWTDNRKAVKASLNGTYYDSTSGSTSWSAGLTLTVKSSSNFSISLGPGVAYDNTVAQWVDNIEDSLMAETYGTRHIFATLNQKTLYAEIRLNWTFNPRLSLQVYLQPFIANGIYSGLKELARPETFDFNMYGQGDSTIVYDPAKAEYRIDPDGPGPAEAFYISDPDFNYKSLRGTAVLRWEFRPGSILYLVWTQNREDDANPGEFRFGRDLGDMVSASGSNVFMIKFTYRFQL
jgi:hypothetical protein